VSVSRHTTQPITAIEGTRVIYIGLVRERQGFRFTAIFTADLCYSLCYIHNLKARCSASVRSFLFTPRRDPPHPDDHTSTRTTSSNSGSVESNHMLLLPSQTLGESLLLSTSPFDLDSASRKSCHGGSFRRPEPRCSVRSLYIPAGYIDHEQRTNSWAAPAVTTYIFWLFELNRRFESVTLFV